MIVSMPYYINTSHKYAIGITPNETMLVEFRMVDPLVLTVRVLSLAIVGYKDV